MKLKCKKIQNMSFVKGKGNTHNNTILIIQQQKKKEAKVQI